MFRSNYTIALCLSASVFLGSSPSLGQVDSSAEIAPPAAAICMVSKNRLVGSEADRETTIVVPAQNVAEMVQKDFAVQPCSRLFGGQDQQKLWRDNICTIAAVGSEFEQDHFEAAIGERPAVLCAMAELAVGQWDAARSLAEDR